MKSKNKTQRAPTPAGARGPRSIGSEKARKKPRRRARVIKTDLTPFIILAAALLMETCFVTVGQAGEVGRWVHTIFFGLFGSASYLIPVGALLIAFFYGELRARETLRFKLIMLPVTAVVLSAVNSLIAQNGMKGSVFSFKDFWVTGTLGESGGVFGGFFGYILSAVFGGAFATALAVIVALALLSFALGKTKLGVWRVFSGNKRDDAPKNETAPRMASSPLTPGKKTPPVNAEPVRIDTVLTPEPTAEVFVPSAEPAVIGELGDFDAPYKSDGIALDGTLTDLDEPEPIPEPEEVCEEGTLRQNFRPDDLMEDFGFRAEEERKQAPKHDIYSDTEHSGSAPEAPSRGYSPFATFIRGRKPEKAAPTPESVKSEPDTAGAKAYSPFANPLASLAHGRDGDNGRSVDINNGQPTAGQSGGRGKAFADTAPIAPVICEIPEDTIPAKPFGDGDSYNGQMPAGQSIGAPDSDTVTVAPEIPDITEIPEISAERVATDEPEIKVAESNFMATALGQRPAYTAPVTPQIPVAPVAAAAPVAPIEPVTPAAPIIPEIPTECVAFAEPVAPVTPDIPSEPAATEAPAIPEIPKISQSTMDFDGKIEMPEPEDETVTSERVYDDGRDPRVINPFGRYDHLRYPDYVRPPTELLDLADSSKRISDDEINEVVRKILEKFDAFHVDAQVTGYSAGPSITRYEVTPGPGTKVKQIMGMADDIELALQSESVSGEVRMVTVPGKSVIGIEVPNSVVSTVSLRTLIENPDFQRAKSKITVCVGLTVTGKPVFMNIDDMPHVLVAGQTKSGKSVAINAMIMSIIYRASPDEVQFILIDPKQVELSVYNEIPHMVMPVIDDPKQAAGALQWAVAEMERRYTLIKNAKLRDRGEYYRMRDQIPDFEYMPQIVIIIDELADLMLQVKEHVEEPINRLAAKARACGINLVIGTQRPSTDIVTGLIKANIPSKIAFRVASNVDSRVILGNVGAEKLLGRGDMLYHPTGGNQIRAQGAFVDTPEIKRVLEYIIKHNGTVEYDPEIMYRLKSETDKLSKNDKRSASAIAMEEDIVMDSADVDFDYLCQAVELIINIGKATTNIIQRNLRIGFNRAANIVDRLEDLGFISKSNGSNRPRDVLVDMKTYLEWKNSNQK